VSWAQAWLRGQTSLGCASTTQRQFPTPKKFECGLGQPPRPHRYVDSCFAFVTAERRNDRFSPTAFRRNAAFAKASCNPRSCDHERQPLRWPASPLLFKGAGEEAATPGQPVACPRFWRSPGDSPSRITGCRWLCRNHPANSGLSRFRCTHFPAEPGGPQYKKNLRLCRTCGCSAFLVEERGKLRGICGRY